MGRSADDSIRRDAQPREITGTDVPSLKNKILLAIPEIEYRVVQSHLAPSNFRQHYVLHEPTRNLEFAYFPSRGLFSLLVATEDGKTVEAGMDVMLAELRRLQMRLNDPIFNLWNRQKNFVFERR